MSQRSSQRAQDEITWQTVGIPLGFSGLDLRKPAAPQALSKLLNARFADDRNVLQRDGHLSTVVQDAADFPPMGADGAIGDEWVYGHGARVSPNNAASWQNAHHPIPGQGRAIFTYGDSDVVWTGDRLLVLRDGGSLGESTFWSRSGATLKHGIPAHQPLQTDSTPPAQVTGDYVETCLTESLRVYLHTGPASALTAYVLDRTSGAIINVSEISGISNDVVECKVVNSAGHPVALWRDFTGHVLYWSYWTGVAWTAASVLAADCYAYDVCAVPGGFHLVWRVNADLFIGHYAGTKNQAVPYVYGVQLADIVGNGSVALDVAPDGTLGVAAETATGLKARVFSASGATLTTWSTVDAGVVWTGGLSIRARGLKDSGGNYPWVIHGGNSANVLIASALVSAGALAVTTSTRYNSNLASKSFRAGDEVFCWLRSANAPTHYLVAGAPAVQVCGYADREEAPLRVTFDDNYGVPHVALDPLDERGMSFTWIRPYNTGQEYDRGGNVRVGDIDMLPTLSTAQYGSSVYLSGSAVRCFDGVELGDAGFHDYPKISAVVQTATGSITPGARKYYRAYLVRYNRRGERFMSAAATYGPVDYATGKTSGVFTIATVPSTNHSDAQIEVYATEDLGTTFYLEGTVPHRLDAATVSFTSSLSDDSLRDKLGDSHAAGVGALSELEEWGPLGCGILATAGDRLWGAGGQVPVGQVQFSKLKEPEEGAGFDSLAGYQTVDNEGGVITSVHALNDTTVVHQARRLDVISGTGPDNYGRGAFTIPQIVLADGAVTHTGTVLTQVGAVFWGQNGPRLLTTDFQVQNISAPVRALAETLTPTGVQVRLSEHEVVWYTGTGDALLWNYLGDNSRWAQWTGLRVAGCSQSSLVTATGRVLHQSADAKGDGGQGFAFVWANSYLRPEEVLAGHTTIRAIGITGEFAGEHRLRARVTYNGSPLWSEQWVWFPDETTYLTISNDWELLTPAQVDALGVQDRSGAYGTVKRLNRQDCRFVGVELSTVEADGPTYIPYQLVLEIGAKGGTGRVPVGTFGD